VTSNFLAAEETACTMRWYAGRLNFQPIINHEKKWLRLAVNITPF